MNQAKYVLFFGLALSTFAAVTGMPLHAADRQAANASWGNLKTLRPGQEIRVVLNDVKSYQGEFQALSDDGITLRQAAGEQTLARQDILRVSSKAQKHRWRNALIGTAVGAGAGLGIGAAADHSSNNSKCGGTGFCFGGMFPNLGKEVLTPVGALAGAVVGAVMPTGGWHDVYRAR
jgi:hypothetical protein